MGVTASHERSPGPPDPLRRLPAEPGFASFASGIPNGHGSPAKMSLRELARSAAALKESVIAADPALSGMLDALPAGHFIAALDSQDPYLGYGHLPPSLLAFARETSARHGPDSLSRYLAVVLLTLITEAQDRIAAIGLPAVFEGEFAASFTRILRGLEAAGGRGLAIEDDLFLKDLGICRGVMIPCVSHLIYRHAGIPRRLLLRQDLGLMLRGFAFTALRTHGRRPFLVNHVHMSMRAHFTPEGRERCYALVAELLRLWPDSRGLVGASWYYDPKVADISPRLAYLRQVPEACGALFLKAGGGAGAADALHRSPTRQRLHAEGRYDPQVYYMIWARKDILRHYGCVT